MADFPDRVSNTKHDFIWSLKRAFNWAIDEEMIDRNPFGRMKKPSCEVCGMGVSPAEYERIIETIEKPDFHDLIETAWETGSQVQELRKFEARFVDMESRRIALPPSKAKGKRHYRIIYLTGRAREIVEQLCRERPDGPPLRNSNGAAWTRGSINCAFCRLQLALGRRILVEKNLAAKRPEQLKTPKIKPGGSPKLEKCGRSRSGSGKRNRNGLPVRMGRSITSGRFARATQARP